MDTARFWQTIASARAVGEDPDDQLSALHDQLQQLEPDEIVQFGRLFDEFWARAYNWDLWGAAFLIGGGCSDDGFIDFRAWLVARGQQAYDSALADPDSLASVLTEADGDAQFEGFQYAASMAWVEKTGRPREEYPEAEWHQASDPTGQPFSEESEDLQARYPRLWLRYAAGS